MSAATDWLARAEREERSGLATGIAESCPKCWKPIDSGEKEISHWTGLQSCACGTVRGDGDMRVTLHGLAEIDWVFESDVEARTAVIDGLKPD